jgi:hypothetical protein
MTLLALLALVSTAAPEATKSDAALAAFHAMTAEQVEAKPAAKAPVGKGWVKVDASQKVRSASFGHATTLLVSEREFYVEYGKSTNGAAKSFGPFELGGKKAAEPCGDRLCPSGEVCCNHSCGICTPPGGMCIQEFCAKKAADAGT